MAEFTAARTGVYYIVVGGGGANFATQAGHYTLSVAEAVDPGATRATAQAITIGTPVKGFIGFGSDTIDMYALTVASNGTLQINLAGTAADTDIKTSLLDSAGSPVVGNTVKPGQTYYVKVDASGGRLSQSPYTLALTFDAAPPGTTSDDLFKVNTTYPGKLSSLVGFAVAAHDDGSGRDAYTSLQSSGWQFLGGSQLAGLTSADVTVGGKTYSYYTFLNASAIVARSADALIVSFRGTDSRWDAPEWLALALHYARFKPLIDAIDAYAAANGIKKVYAVGHSR